MSTTHEPNIHEVRERLAEYLAAAERGEEVIIRRRNQPVARLVAVAPPRARAKPRPIGKAPDAGEPLPASFFEPLPAALAAALAGTEPDPLTAATRTARRPR